MPEGRCQKAVRDVRTMARQCCLHRDALDGSLTLYLRGLQIVTGVGVLAATAICGTLQAVAGGQPLLIVGVAEPIVLTYQVPACIDCSAFAFLSSTWTHGHQPAIEWW